MVEVQLAAPAAGAGAGAAAGSSLERELVLNMTLTVAAPPLMQPLVARKADSPFAAVIPICTYTCRA